MKNIKLIISLLVLISSFLSCKKYIDISSPSNMAELSRIFESDQTAIAAASGVYAQMVTSSLTFCNGGITVYAGLSSDELQNVNSSASVDAFRNNTLLADNATILSTFWSNPYKNIFHINSVLEGLGKSDKLTKNIKWQLTSEMLYARALHYFYLANLYRDVPYTKKTDYALNSVLPRTAYATVIQDIEADLLNAKANWPYGTTNGTLSKNRPGIDAINALLARVYLYRGNWQGAFDCANAVITANRYTLESLSNVFLSTSKETIFSIMKPTANTAEGATFNPSSATVKPSYVLSPQLLNTFENGDKRKQDWTKTNTISGQGYVYPYKYKVKSGTTVTEHYVVQRLAEVYLIRAEAAAQLEDKVAAITDIDKIRNRAGLALLATTNPTISKPALITQIYKERQLELCFEWGFRWFDLKRTGNVDIVLANVKPTYWKSYAQWYPIPFAELVKNPFLIQNAGYNN